MAKQDYIPKTDGDLLAWHDNFKTQIAAVAATFGLTAAEVTAVSDRNTDLHTTATAANFAKAIAQAKTAEKQNSFRLGTTEARAPSNRCKTHPAYTAALGQQLGIISPEDTTDLNNSKPTLQAAAVVVGSVTISFNKSISSGVRILTKRGAETAFTLLAVDTASPYIDTRTNLAASPELRQYQAQYLLGDDPIGLVSDILDVTVPG
jgi:hypothetical protein